MSTWSDEALDRRIDDVARALTAHQPSGTFEARVLARLHAKRPRIWWQRPLVVAPACAVALLALAVIWQAPGPVREGPPSAAPGVDRPLRAARSEPAAEVAGGTPATEPVARRATSRARREDAALPMPPRDGDLAELALEQLDVVPLGSPRFTALESIELPELTVPPIDVAPIGPDGRQK